MFEKAGNESQYSFAPLHPPGRGGGGGGGGDGGDKGVTSFCRRSKNGDFGKSKLSGLGGFLPVYQASRSKEFFLP